MFVAALPPDDVVDSLEEFLAPRREATELRWTVPEQWHLTLAFFGSVPDRSLDDLVERLARAARRRSPMSSAVAGGGAFPHVGNAKVLWTGLDLDDADRAELRHLATGCRTAGSRAGIGVDGRRFHPHLTLARLRPPIEATSWVRLLDGYRSPPWPVTEITLIESHLGEGPHRRPRYEFVETFPIGHTA